MFCYHCGCQLSEHDFCTACGADVGLYKKIMYVSNRFYNDGLEKAGVRDLTGAINSLRQSLKFNKNHIEARNLLGLVYFEMGEVVAALSEWVISKNLRPEKNIADDYINMIQSNASRLDSINQTIKKYNQAFAYCTQDGKDLAILQLKKVLSLNPKFIQAHQLLALLYMDSEQWERAKKELDKCIEIDRNNTMTLRYLKEVEAMLIPDESVKPSSGKRKKEDVLRYQSDNEIIIQPMNVKERKGGGVSTLVNMGIGLIIGLAAMYFLVVPSRVAEVRSQMNQDILNLGDQLDAKTVNIQELEAQIKDLEDEKEALRQDLEGYVGEGGTLSTVDNLLAATSTYLETQDAAQTAQNLESIAESVAIEETSEAFQNLYGTLLGSIGPELSTNYYTEGYTAYRNGDFAAAIESFDKATYYNEANMDAWFFLGEAYRGIGDTENAVMIYNKVIELFPGTERARRAQNFITNMAVG
ncbi:MAG: tetratricopeptide repeat protein [Candidatus Gastranaerophilales bacterium]|nr:tetratricopeptide repeat protein [Candidatus Gastranaerophilales bacterium]